MTAGRWGQGDMAQYDVAIVGGGLVGCATAFYLAQSGARVVVLEKDQVNAQASGQNAGSLHFQLEHRLVEHGDKLIDQVAPAIPLNTMAIKAWAGLEAELEADLEIVMHGGLMIAETAADVAQLEKKFTAEQRYGLPTELLDGPEVAARAPYLTRRALAAGYCPYEGHANPRLVTPAYARRALALGAVIETGVEVTALTPVREGWRVEAMRLGDGRKTTLTAAKILNACGAWAGYLASMVNIHLPIYPVPLTMNVTEPAAPLVGHLIQHVGRNLSLKQVRDGNFLVGGGWPSAFRMTNGVTDFNAKPRQKLGNMLGNLAVAADVVPALANVSLIRSWTGIVGVTADQLPLLGEVSKVPGFFVAAGGSGFTLGPVYARAMADMMLEREPEADFSLYGPNRFNHINSFMGLR